MILYKRIMTREGYAYEPIRCYCNNESLNCDNCNHLLSMHYDPSYNCNVHIEPGMADGLLNFCYECEHK